MLHQEGLFKEFNEEHNKEKLTNDGDVLHMDPSQRKLHLQRRSTIIPVAIDEGIQTLVYLEQQGGTRGTNTLNKFQPTAPAPAVGKV